MRDDSVIRQLPVVVPAQPGYFIADYMPAEGGMAHEFSLEPIIAWAVQSCCKLDDYSEVGDFKSADAYPITIEGGTDRTKLIKNPDGSFTFPGSTYFPNESSALKEFAKEEKRKRSRA